MGGGWWVVGGGWWVVGGGWWVVGGGWGVVGGGWVGGVSGGVAGGGVGVMVELALGPFSKGWAEPASRGGGQVRARGALGIPPTVGSDPTSIPVQTVPVLGTSSYSTRTQEPLHVSWGVASSSTAAGVVVKSSSRT